MTPRVVVVGLGPAGPDLLTAETRAAIDAVPRRYLRTTRHPAAAALADAESFDHLYDTSSTFDDVYRRVVDALAGAAVEHGEVLYAVPGSPLVAERTVELVLSDPRVDARVLPALSFLDLAWSRLGIDPLTAGVRLVDGRRFAIDAAGERGPLVVGQCDTTTVLSEIKLSVDDEAPPTVTVLQRLGLPDEAVFETSWDELDRAVVPDHLTTIYLPRLAAPVAGEVARFADLVRTLRERCPWDREQTHRSLTRHLLEETYELLEAIEADDPAHVEEELGDLLFQVVFHATLGAETGDYTLADVARGVHDKLVHRHPHVFGQVEAVTSDAVMLNWERIKQAEKGHASVMDGVPGSLPSLLYAHKVQRKAASAGVDLAGTIDGIETEEQLGEVLFAMVAAARRIDVDPESALRAAAARHRDRFKTGEAVVAALRGAAG